MTNLKNLEIINLSTIDGKLVATLSYQNPDDILTVNNGYDIIEVPVNIREYQLSVRGNMLADQSIQIFNESVEMEKTTLKTNLIKFLQEEKREIEDFVIKFETKEDIEHKIDGNELDDEVLNPKTKKQQTPVDWLIDQLEIPGRGGVPHHIAELAKELQRKSIIDACDYGIELRQETPFTGEEYYERTYIDGTFDDNDD